MPGNNKYIGQELEWLESKAEAIKQYIDDNPYDEIQERIVSLVTGKTNTEKIAATIEVQHRDYRESLKDYGLLLEIIKKLRESEAVQIESRGKGEISSIAKKFLADRK